MKSICRSQTNLSASWELVRGIPGSSAASTWSSEVHIGLNWIIFWIRLSLDRIVFWIAFSFELDHLLNTNLLLQAVLCRSHCWYHSLQLQNIYISCDLYLPISQDKSGWSICLNLWITVWCPLSTITLGQWISCEYVILKTAFQRITWKMWN